MQTSTDAQAAVCCRMLPYAAVLPYADGYKRCADASTHALSSYYTHFIRAMPLGGWGMGGGGQVATYIPKFFQVPEVVQDGRWWWGERAGQVCLLLVYADVC
jgi:hypothetical protein